MVLCSYIKYLCIDGYILYYMNGDLENKLKKGTKEIESIEEDQDIEIFSHDKRLKNLTDRVL